MSSEPLHTLGSTTHTPVPTRSIAQRLNGERLTLVGWSRAILLQFAHPLIAAGVSEHSSFTKGGLEAVARLHHTVHAALSLTFGSELARMTTLNNIARIHRRVHGVLREDVGRYSAGTCYSAEDPSLVLWVHATLLDSIPLVYELFVRPVDASERDAFCREAADVAITLGARPDDVPTSWLALQRYMHDTLSSGRLAVGAQARTLARRVLEPGFALLKPAAALNRIVAIGLLPAEIRMQYGFEWDGRADRRFTRSCEFVRFLRRMTPRALSQWPEARVARPDDSSGNHAGAVGG